MSNDMDDLLHEDELEPEGLDEDVTEADLEERHVLEEEEVELEAEEGEEGEEPIVGPLEAEEEEDTEEAEATLDEILRQRFEGEEAELEEEEGPEARVAVPGEEQVRPRTAEEFVCQSCFLVKSRTQLADTKGSLCRDCANNNVRT